MVTGSLVEMLGSLDMDHTPSKASGRTPQLRSPGASLLLPCGEEDVCEPLSGYEANRKHGSAYTTFVSKKVPEIKYTGFFPDALT